MHIAFAINRLALLGLGATLTSLVRNCADSQGMSLWFLCAHLWPTDKQHIDELLRDEQFQGEVHYIDFDAKARFGHLPALHGDWTAYGRLLVPSLIAADTCLYLDADLVVNLDIRQLQHLLLDGHLLAAVSGCAVAESLDGAFFTDRLGWAPTIPYFNSGVVLFNSKLWRTQRADDQWLKLVLVHGPALVSHDQTILNAICGGRFLVLLDEFNNAWPPVRPQPLGAHQSVIHFVGSPKPWDVFGRTLHEGHGAWQVYHTQQWHKQYGGLTFEKLDRYWKIRRSILKNILAQWPPKANAPKKVPASF